MNNIIMKILEKINLTLAKHTGLIITRYKRRHSVEFAKEHFHNKPISVAEVGVFKGNNALYMLENLNIEKLYLIDPYLKYPDYRKVSPLAYGRLDEAEEEAREKLKEYEDKIVWIKKFSDKAVNDLPNDLDFIYIDGNHSYEYVKQDMENYYPKVKENGILAGHDIASIRHKGVARAFAEFIIEKDKTPTISKTDWWVVK